MVKIQIRDNPFYPFCQCANPLIPPFGASGMLSIEMAILMLQHQEFIGVPFVQEQNPRKQIRKVLINAVGFGGNAVSVLLSI
jgi:3-oxoacyl-(acyl-carrier-protein) synthase